MNSLPYILEGKTIQIQMWAIVKVVEYNVLYLIYSTPWALFLGHVSIN